MNERLASSTEPGYRHKVLIQIRNTWTDLLPHDLTSETVNGKLRLSFNWRTYLCTYLSEQGAIAALTKSVDMKGFADSFHQENDAKPEEQYFTAMFETCQAQMLKLQNDTKENFRNVGRARRQRFALFWRGRRGVERDEFGQAWSLCRAGKGRCGKGDLGTRLYWKF